MGWVATAGFIGFVGNEAVAIFRIRIGRQINSAALIADGYHARTDGLTSLAVVIGAAGVWLGFPLADPIVGLLITVAILGIVWQSSKAVFTRVLDGVDAEVPEELRHAAEHVPGVLSVEAARARWLGHRLTADVDVSVDGSATLKEADSIAAAVREELLGHVSALATVRVLVSSFGSAREAATAARHRTSHHHAPAPVAVQSELAKGILEIVETPAGERMQLKISRAAPGLSVEVCTRRNNDRIERVSLTQVSDDSTCFMSSAAPEEPHEFDGKLRLYDGKSEATVAFHMAESGDHH